MYILWEGGEEGGISAETSLVGAFHVFKKDLVSLAVLCSLGVLRCPCCASVSVLRSAAVARAAGLGLARASVPSYIIVYDAIEK